MKHKWVHTNTEAASLSPLIAEMFGCGVHVDAVFSNLDIKVILSRLILDQSLFSYGISKLLLAYVSHICDIAAQ